jgi:hypothetical protein
MPRRRLLVASVAAVAVTGGLVAAGVAAHHPAHRAAADRPSTPGTVTRGPFCTRITDAAVLDAVGGSATSTTWSDGQRVALEPGLTDLAQEYGCAFSTAGGTDRARAWVFAAPVSRPEARALVAEVRARPACDPVVGDRLGRPGATVTCSSGAATSVVQVGLVDHAWVHCDLARPSTVTVTEVTERADRWCAHAVAALRSR